MVSPAENLPNTVEERSLSTGDVISMSMQNVIAFVSSYRPWWSEFLALGFMDCPTSFSSAISRVNFNFHHFAVNYSLMTATLIVLFSIGDMTALFTIVFFAIMWLLFYFCRDHSLVLCGRHINDRVIVFVLIFGSLFALWFTHCLQSLVLGILTGVFLSLVHAIIRNQDDLFVQEQEVVPSTFLHWC